MKSKNKNIANLRADLLSEEKNIHHDLGTGSHMVKTQVLKSLKNAGVVLAGVLAGVTIYKLVENNKKGQKKKSSAVKKTQKEKKSSVPLTIVGFVISFVAKQFVPFAIKKLKKYQTKRVGGG